MSESVAASVLSDSPGTSGSLPRRFVLSAGAILTVAGVAKVWSSLGSAKFLAVADPIIGIKFGQLMLFVGLAEIAIALVCFFSKRQTLALGLVAWLSTNFVVYRLGMWWMNWHRPCGCLGNLADAVHLSLLTADNTLKVSLTYLLLGSVGLLAGQFMKNSRICIG